MSKVKAGNCQWALEKKKVISDFWQEPLLWDGGEERLIRLGGEGMGCAEWDSKYTAFFQGLL